MLLVCIVCIVDVCLVVAPVWELHQIVVCQKYIIIYYIVRWRQGTVQSATMWSTVSRSALHKQTAYKQWKSFQAKQRDVSLVMLLANLSIEKDLSERIDRSS